MTISNNTENAVAQVEMVSATIDGFEVSVPKGTLIIRAAETIGIQIQERSPIATRSSAGEVNQNAANAS